MTSTLTDGTSLLDDTPWTGSPTPFVRSALLQRPGHSRQGISLAVWAIASSAATGPYQRHRRKQTGGSCPRR